MPDTAPDAAGSADKIRKRRPRRGQLPRRRSPHGLRARRPVPEESESVQAEEAQKSVGLQTVM
ncbi:hypothetical protein GCM10010343_12680 [Streptomyces avidinii]|nr:hypothetical protein GCM10010343_12680 [Streptomyces avidinii]